MWPFRSRRSSVEDEDGDEEYEEYTDEEYEEYTDEEYETDDEDVEYEEEEEEVEDEEHDDEGEYEESEHKDSKKRLQKVAGTENSDFLKGDENDEEEEECEDDDDNDNDDGGMEIPEGDLPSLLVLAAQHDRVDVLQDLLGRSEATSNGGGGSSSTPSKWLDESYALHAAVAAGSINAAGCLLRMGADPSRKEEGGLTAYDYVEHKKHKGSKKEELRHAFFAEALRAIGSDDVDRLMCLLRSGYSEDSLGRWANDMNAVQCLQRLSPPSNDNSTVPPQLLPQTQPKEATKEDTMRRRIEEGRSLVFSLKRGVEEMRHHTKVCGLLLGEKGSSALVAHVRQLKAEIAQTQMECDHYQQRLQQSQNSGYGKLNGFESMAASTTKIYASTNGDVPDATEANDEGIVIENMEDQLKQNEEMVRSLRASLEGAMEENALAMGIIEKRGLTGAVRLALKLREQLQTLQQELNFQKEQLLLSDQHQDDEEDDQWRDASPDLEDDEKEDLDDGDDDEEYEDEEEDSEEEIMKPSVAVASGKSNALVLRSNTQYLPINIWDLVCRIIGLSRDVVTNGDLTVDPIGIAFGRNCKGVLVV